MTYFFPVAAIPERQTGTECILSRSRRLAERNQIPLVTLMAKVLLPAALGRTWAYYADPRPIITGAGGEAFTRVLEAISGASNLSHLTTASLKARWGLGLYLPLCKHRKWCAQCYQLDATRKHGPYDRLEWRLEAVKYCTRHQSPLCSTCPKCRAEKIPIMTALDCSGFCPRCNAWLGADLDSTEVDEDDYQFWTSAQISALANEQPTALGKQDLVEALARLIEARFDGSNKKLADYLGCSKPTITGWLKGGCPITAGRLIDISYITGLAATRIICNSFGSSSSAALRTLPIKRRQKYAKKPAFDQHRANIVLTEFINGLRPEITNAEQLSIAAGSAVHTLRNRMPVAYRLALGQIDQKRREASARTKRDRAAIFENAMRAAIDRLLAQNERLTRRALHNNMTAFGHVVTRTTSLRLDLALRELRASGNSTKANNPA